MEKVNVTIRMDAEEVAFLDKLAGIADRDRSYLIKQAVSEYIALQRWQVEEIEKALGESDAGQFASETDVIRTFDVLRG